MKKKLITALMAFGMTKVLAEKHLATVPDEDDPTFDVDKFISDFKDNEKELLKNDKEFVGTIQKGEAAKRNDIFLTKLKRKTGLTQEEIKAKGWDEQVERHLEDIIELGISKIRTKGDQTNEQLQAENVAFAAEIKKYKEEIIPSLEQKGDTIKRELTIASKQEKFISKLPKKLRVGEGIASIALNAKLSERGIVASLDDAGNIEYKMREGNLKVKNKTGDKFLTAEELVSEILDEEKLLENSAGGGEEGGTKPTIIVDGGATVDPSVRFPHLKKAQDNAEQNKADIAANKNR